jgi:hypothetical protein
MIKKNPKNIYRKGEMILNAVGWPGIVIEGTRGNDPEIINIVEMFGYEHESGSIYTNEVIARLTKEQFESYKKKMGYDSDEKQYFKGELIEPIGNGKAA